MRISVIGAGYVGLVAGACLGKAGHQVALVDIDGARLEQIDRGISPIHDPGLEDILSRVNMQTPTDYQKVAEWELIFLCFGTPSNDDGSMSLEHIEKAAKQLPVVLRERTDYCVIAVRSTVVPGTTGETVIPVLGKSGGEAGRWFGKQRGGGGGTGCYRLRCGL